MDGSCAKGVQRGRRAAFLVDRPQAVVAVSHGSALLTRFLGILCPLHPGSVRRRFSGGIGVSSATSAPWPRASSSSWRSSPSSRGPSSFTRDGAPARLLAVEDLPRRLPQEQQVLRGELGLRAAQGQPAGRRVPGRLPSRSTSRSAGGAGEQPPRRPRVPPSGASSRSRARCCARPRWRSRALERRVTLPGHHGERHAVHRASSGRCGDHERVRATSAAWARRTWPWSRPASRRP